jgi:hypothetical protein
MKMPGGLLFLGLMLIGCTPKAEPTCRITPFEAPWGEVREAHGVMQRDTRCWIDTPVLTGTLGTTVAVRAEYGAVTVSGNGTSLVYEPKRGFVGDDSFTYVKRGVTPNGQPLRSIVTIFMKVL